MDAVKSQSLRKVSNPAMAKTPKTRSQVSVAPSQMSENTRLANAEKNPLDALSRNTMRSASEKRSGLQDIDEDYLKKMSFPPSTPARYDLAAGQRTPNPVAQTESSLARMQPGAESAQSQVQAQGMQHMYATTQQVMAQGNMPNAQVAQPLPPQQQQQNMPSEPVQGVQPVGVAQANIPQQSQAQLQAAAQQQQIPQQINYLPAGGEPELCTTCPNCQATIYLARTNMDMQPAPGMVGMNGQPEGTGLMAAKQ